MIILDAIAQYANSMPNDIVYESTQGKLTWKELNDYSDHLAYQLQEVLADDKTPIIVYGHKHPYMIVCFIACVKSGRAYVPIDHSIPLTRINNIISELQSPLILATETLQTIEGSIWSLDFIKTIAEDQKFVLSENHSVKSSDIFYIIFTSGSTGQPKGVQITAECLENFVKWSITLGNVLERGQTYIFINQAPFSFDLSVMDLYMSLYSGGTLWALEKNIQDNLSDLFESLKQSNANVWVSTPSFAEMCLADHIFSQKLLPQMKLFLFCGECLTNQTAQRLQDEFPNAKIVNTYGPTESTVAVTEIDITSELINQVNPLPLGRPKSGTYILIMDENGTVLPDLQKGEIVIVGDSVSIGYFNRPDLTKKVFRTYTLHDTCYRLYHTGDRGYCKDGLLYYCGRMDLQIKMHGYRIELEDVESNILKYCAVRQVAVLPSEKNGKITSLKAYVVPEYEIIDKFAESQKIREQLKENVPSYMVPKKVIFLSSLPMTSNGKVNRNMLEGEKI